MTTFYLVRHASNDFFSHTIVGRTPGVHLNETGKREANELAGGLGGEKIQKILTSPMERCRETAAPLAARLQLPAETSDALLEVDFGDWTGKTFKELDASEAWRQWNAFRSGHRVPNGETMLEVQQRFVGLMLDLHRDFRGQRIALFSHGDPLRAAMVYFFGAPLESIGKIDISPASVTILRLTDWNAQIRCLNLHFGQSPLPR
ncbi:MAG TPA: histidine phosphatase family protein [Candidatus Angelobacter sp.]|nr:histidine phosphatase family protein [Candidatus Angelobacter sp.]